MWREFVVYSMNLPVEAGRQGSQFQERTAMEHFLSYSEVTAESGLGHKKIWVTRAPHKSSVKAAHTTSLRPHRIVG